MNRLRTEVALTFLCGLGSFSVHAIEVSLEFSDHVFSPSDGETITLAVLSTDEIPSASLAWVAQDGREISRLPIGPIQAGEATSVVWDGKTEGGLLVPDEVYFPVILDDSRDLTDHIYYYSSLNELWGQEYNPDVSVEKSGFYLLAIDRPARMQIRVGIEDGPLLSQPLDWQPFLAGEYKIYYDDACVSDFSEKTLKHVVRGFTLPESSVIATGNVDYTYAQFASEYLVGSYVHQPSEPILNESSSHFASLPVEEYFSPRVNIVSLEKEADGTGSTVLDLDANEKQRLSTERYELVVYVGTDFVVEEERGYVPISVNINFDKFRSSIPNVIANLNTYSGKIGVACRRFGDLDNEVD